MRCARRLRNPVARTRCPNVSCRPSQAKTSRRAPVPSAEVTARSQASFSYAHSRRRDQRKPRSARSTSGRAASKTMSIESTAGTVVSDRGETPRGAASSTTSTSRSRNAASIDAANADARPNTITDDIPASKYCRRQQNSSRRSALVLSQRNCPWARKLDHAWLEIRGHHNVGPTFRGPATSPAGHGLYAVSAQFRNAPGACAGQR